MVTTQNENIKPISYDLPYSVNITLYKYNYIDNLIISIIRKNSKFISLPDNNGLIIEKENLIKILNTYFKNELLNAQNLTEITIKKDISSIYFINRIINNFHNLKYININISKKRNFTRVLELTKERKTLNFDIRVISSILDLPKYFTTTEQLKRINTLLKRINLIKEDDFITGKAFYYIDAQEFMTRIIDIEEYFIENSKLKEQYIETIDVLYSLIDQKYENDNSKLLIVTDYPN